MLVLRSVDVPGEGIAIILGIDRILDMCRTVLNVAGDLVLASCVAQGEPEHSRDTNEFAAQHPLLQPGTWQLTAGHPLAAVANAMRGGGPMTLFPGDLLPADPGVLRRSSTNAST